jgi:hypothetical protein
MKIVDQLFGWVLVALGIVWCAFTFRAHGVSAVSWYSSGVLIVVAGLVNIARAGASNGFLRFGSACANIFVLALALATAFSLRAVLRQNPQAPVLAVAAAIETIFSIWA